MADFSLSRSTRVQAPSGRVHALVDDFREWPKWSPWEGLDPDLKREYGGPHHGVGSTYHWSGNKKAGEGTMRITVVDLQFLKPFKASNITTFTLVPAGDAGELTDVTWTMTGARNALMGIMGKLYFDKAIGADFERGLASLKQAAERV
jgi:hypothetical protein